MIQCTLKDALSKPLSTTDPATAKDTLRKAMTDLLVNMHLSAVVTDDPHDVRDAIQISATCVHDSVTLSPSNVFSLLCSVGVHHPVKDVTHATTRWGFADGTQAIKWVGPEGTAVVETHPDGRVIPSWHPVPAVAINIPLVRPSDAPDTQL